VRRVGVILASIAVAVAAVVGIAATGDGEAYEVRGAFDNAAFLVPGVEVRIAGARVGTVTDVEVSGIDEAVREDGTPEPGKAIVVMRIDDPGFQDFRADASCLIRPQSLIGERFVECVPTRSRAPGVEPPPPLEEISEGEPGAGQRFLALERNGKTVDLDLVNNIMEEPYPDRFRLILNDLGAGLAARGEDLAEIVERSNPALRRTNEVLAILARQSRELADLARDGERVLEPLARDRESVSGFVNEAQTVAEASAERSADIEAGFERLPGALRELRPAMSDLSEFADQATPALADLRRAAPSLTRATRALGPFSDATTRALTTLGDAAAEAERPLVESDPVVRQVRGLARSGSPAARNLARLLRSMRRTRGFDFLTQLIYNTSGAVNSFDSSGPFMRALLPLNNCVDYVIDTDAACDGNFTRQAAPGRALARTLERQAARRAAISIARALGGEEDSPRGSAPGQRRGGSERDAQLLLDYFLGDADEGEVGDDEADAGSENGR
jgi:phospholipid/cholesterol/gamma-HCH transport system substrate-binding protein